MKDITVSEVLELQKGFDVCVKHNKEYQPHKAIRGEIAEMESHLGFESWKTVKVDKDQASLELVDVYAFVLSLINLSMEKNTSFVNEVFFTIFESVKLQELIDSGLPKDLEENPIYHYENAVTNLVVLSQGLFLDLCESEDNTVRYATLLKCVAVIAKLEFNLSLLELHELYIAKKTLSKFRQDNGYNEQRYKKMWHGEEDNVHLMRIFKEKGEVTYEDLEKLYTQEVH